MDRDHVRRSKAVQQRTGRTFHLATRLFPERVRHPTYVLYAFFRVADEVVDDPGAASPAEQAARLRELRAAALGEAPADDPVVSAFRDVVCEHDIDDAEVAAFVDAMLADVDTARYGTYADLAGYMRGSAAAVGAMVLSVTGADDPERARPHALRLGEAFQMTNFLRDVREDATEHGRVYLPLSTLAEHGVAADEVLRLEYSDGFADAVADELARTEQLYREGVAGIRHLPGDCQFPVLLAAVLYAEYHRLIRARDCDVLSARPRLGRARTAWLLARTRWHWAWNSDPETVFRRVSAIPEAEAARSGPSPGPPVPTR